MTTDNLFNVYNPGPAFRIGSPWGMRFHPVKKKNLMHAGQDLPANQGTAIPAAADGTVFSVADIAGYGHCIVIQHTPQDGSPMKSKGSASHLFFQNPGLVAHALN